MMHTTKIVTCTVCGREFSTDRREPESKCGACTVAAYAASKNAAHTPGPWRVGDAGTTVFGPKTDNPAPRTIGYITRHATEGVEDRANARLMAAAPALFAALEAIVEAGRMSDSPRAVYCADIAREALVAARPR